jgi:hypothetical protein
MMNSTRLSKDTLFNVNLSLQKTILFTEDIFKLFANIHTLNIRRCLYISDKAFSYLKGYIHWICFACNQNTITDEAFSYLKGIHILILEECEQSTITDEAFKHLQG